MPHPSDWTLLHTQLHRVLRQRQLLQKHQRVLVAVSGGQDSLCLIRLLLDLQPKWGWQLAIAHCNHRWRTDSADNAAYVEQLASAWQVPYHSATAAEVLSSEADARQWRYQALAEFALEQRYSAVVTGHTASDRAETLLYNLVRGSGADGLQALTWQRELTSGIFLVRPLLHITRTETAQFCCDFNLKVWQDRTNQDWHYARNRIRQELIPYLQDHFNPQVEQALAQTAELLHAEVAYLEAAAEEWLRQTVQQTESVDWEPGNKSPMEQPPHHLSSIHLDRSVLRQVPLALQRRVIRQFLQKVLPIAPNFAHVEKLSALITAPNRTQTDPFPGGAIAQVEGNWICFKGSETQESSEL